MKKGLMTALVLGSAVAAMADNSVTFATFADPSGNAHNPVFVHDRGAKTLSGAWGNAGLTLIAPGAVGAPTVTNARFGTTTLALTEVIPGLYATGPGSISFTDSSNNPLFNINFSSATFVEGLGAGASTFRGQNITVSGPLVPPGTTMTQFNFALANQAIVGNTTTYTASFTSSAVPEPASMIALGAGLLALARRRRQA